MENPPPLPQTVTLVQTPPRRRGCLRFVLFVFFVLVVLVVLNRLLTFPTGISFPVLGRSVGVVRIEGPINDSAQTVKVIRSFRSNPLILAIILRLDTPGGAVAASEEIYREALKARTEDKKIVIASMGNAAASGGYYIAMAADEIYANAGTITGSIGVIALDWNLQQILQRLQIDPIVLKSGEHKDTGSPLREMRETDRHLLMGLIRDSYRQFVREVLRSRAPQIERALADHPTRIADILSTATTQASTDTLEWQAFKPGTVAAEVGVSPAVEDALRWMADGRIYTGEQAQALGLIDKIGTLTDAIEQAGERAGLGKKPSVVERSPESAIPSLLGMAARQFWQEFSRGRGASVEMRSEGL